MKTFLKKEVICQAKKFFSGKNYFINSEKYCEHILQITQNSTIQK